jgi:hypothetical protein
LGNTRARRAVKTIRIAPAWFNERSKAYLDTHIPNLYSPQIILEAALPKLARLGIFALMPIF